MYKMYTLTRLHEAVMMVKDYKLLIELRYIVSLLYKCWKSM